MRAATKTVRGELFNLSGIDENGKRDGRAIWGVEHYYLRHEPNVTIAKPEKQQPDDDEPTEDESEEASDEPV